MLTVLACEGKKFTDMRPSCKRHYLRCAHYRVSGFSGMGIVEWWNSGMVEWMHVLYQVTFGACWQ